MTSNEKRIRQLEHLHLPSNPGQPFYWEEFVLLYALSRNIPKFWPDPYAMPKFLRDEYGQLGMRFKSRNESPND